MYWIHLKYNVSVCCICKGMKWLLCCLRLSAPKGRGWTDQRSLHLFGSSSETSSVSHSASGITGLAPPEVYEKQREKREREGGRARKETSEGVKWWSVIEGKTEEWAGWHEKTEREMEERRRFDSSNEDRNGCRWWADVFHSASSVVLCVCWGSPRAPEEPEGPDRVCMWIQVQQVQPLSLGNSGKTAVRINLFISVNTDH